MLKKILWIVLALVAAFAAYLFWQAGRSESVAPQILSAGNFLPEDDLLTVAFGSCNNQDKPQDYWPTIARNDPEYWVWAGDNVYGDRYGIDGMVRVLEDYAADPAYAAFAAGVTEVHGIYDDHDYGVNDGGKDYPHKDRARRALRDFLGYPAADLIDTTRSGSYYATLLGDGYNTLHLIVLDTRWNRDDFAPAVHEGHRYGPNPRGDILGEEQWAWLEKELRASRAAAHLIVSSIQVLPEDHGYEKWANFPTARTRLLDLLAELRLPQVLLVSGDRHLAEISRVEHRGYPVYEITSSGLTHSYEGADEPNRHRVGDLYDVKNFGVLRYVYGAAAGPPQLLAQVRSVENNEVLTELLLAANGQTADPAALRQTLAKSADMPQQLTPCPNKPNCVSTQTDDPTKRREPLTYTGSRADAQARLKQLVGGMKRTRLKTESEGYLHYTFKTWPIPFIDDAEFLFDDAEKLIHYRSASRVGHSDLGVNGKRMAKIAAAWEATGK